MSQIERYTNFFLVFCSDNRRRVVFGDVLENNSDLL